MFIGFPKFQPCDTGLIEVLLQIDILLSKGEEEEDPFERDNLSLELRTRTDDESQFYETFPSLFMIKVNF